MGNTQYRSTGESNKSIPKLALSSSDVLKNTSLISSLKSYNAIRECFDKYDLDKNGFIDAKEYELFIQDIVKQNQIDPSHLDGLLGSFDTNGDGQISYSEFISLVSKLNPQTILLLGAGGCGKSTLYKQFQIYDSNKKFPITRGAIHHNLLHGVLDIAQECVLDEQGAILYGKLKSFSSLSTLDLEVRYVECSEDLKQLWKNEIIQKRYQSMKDAYQIPESFEFLIQHNEAFSPKYEPSEDDILYASVKTTGFNEFKSKVNQVFFHVYDTGGQRSERRKWERLYPKANHICFIISLSNFDELCYEDNKTNRMIESLNLFNQIVNDPDLKEKPLIIIFNKIDLFKKKIQNQDRYEDFLQVFPDYKDGKDEQKILDYITNQFLDLHPNPREIGYFFTCSVDKNLMKGVFDDIFFIKPSECKGKSEPKENKLLLSKTIQGLTSFSSIKGLFDKFDLDKSGYLEKDELKSFNESISKEHEKLTLTVLEELYSLFDLDNDGKVSYKEFKSIISKVKPPSFLFIGSKDCGKSNLLKHFQLFNTSFVAKKFIKDMMLENLHSLISDLANNYSYDTEETTEIHSLRNKINNLNIPITSYEKYFKEHDYFKIFKTIATDKGLREYLECKYFNFDTTRIEYFLNKTDDLSNPKYEPTIEDYYHVDMKFNERLVYHRNLIGEINFKIYSMGEDSSKWKNYFSRVDYVCFVAPLSEFDLKHSEENKANRMSESINSFKSLLNEMSLIDKQFIIFFTKLDSFEKKIQIKEKYEAFLDLFPNYKDGQDSKKIMNFIKAQYLSLTEHSLRKKVISYDVVMHDQSQMKDIIEEIFNS